MRRVIIVLLLAVIAFGIYWFFIRQKPTEKKEADTAPIALQDNTTHFNRRLEGLLNAYLEVKDAFVNSDTARVRRFGSLFIAALDSIPMEELKKDSNGIYESMATNISDLKTNMTNLINGKDLQAMRQDFSMVSELLYPSVKLVKYRGPDLYLQHCPMAFGDDKGANWISASDKIMNPYLGKDHPEYRATMLHCGEVLDSIKSN